MFGKCDNNKKLFGISQCHPDYRSLKDAFLFDIKDKDKNTQKSIREQAEHTNCKDYENCGQFLLSHSMNKTINVLVKTFKWVFPKVGEKDFRSPITGPQLYDTAKHTKPSTSEEGPYSMPNPQTTKDFYNTKKPVQDSASELKKDINRIYENLIEDRDIIRFKMHYFDIIIICIYLRTKYPNSFYDIPNINSNTIDDIVTKPYIENEKTDKQKKYKEILHTIFRYAFANNYNDSIINNKQFTSRGINDSYMWLNKYYTYLFELPNNEKNNEVCKNLLEYLYRQLDMQDKPKYLKNKHSIRYDINNIDFNNNNLRYLPCYIEPTYAVVSKNHRGRKSSSSVQPSSSYAPPRPTALKPGRKPTSYEEDEEL